MATKLHLGPTVRNHILLALALLLWLPATGHAARRRLLYVAHDRGIAVYDIDAGHKLVKEIAAPTLLKVRGMAGHAGTGRLYVSHYGTAEAHGGGKVVAIDLASDKVLWEKAFDPSVDRMALTPDGKTLYLPSGEDEWSAHWFVVDAATGQTRGRIEYGTRTHNTIASPDGKRVYLSTLRSPFLGVVDTATNRITGELGPFGGTIRPFTINGRGTLVYANVDGLLGFEMADLTSAGLNAQPVSGHVMFRAEVTGFPTTDPSFGYSHGIALTPDEKEVWVCSFFQRLHVFDVSHFPPKQVAEIPVHGAPMWMNFSLEGDFAYPSTGDVIDTRTRQIAGKVTASRIQLEVDFDGARPTEVGNQFGLGRVTGPPTNRAPEVTIVEPAAGAALGGDFFVNVDAKDGDGAVREVELIARGPFDKPGMRLTLPRRLAVETAEPFVFPLHLTEPGRYELTARAIDDRAAVGQSKPILLDVGTR